jgi:hypothetical protein
MLMVSSDASAKSPRRAPVTVMSAFATAPGPRFGRSQLMPLAIISVRVPATLNFQGHTHRFRLRGLGVGGFGISELRVNGDVYALSRLADFPGLYGTARAGAVAGSAEVRGGVWLQNSAGVYTHLRPQRTGVALQVGADGLLIELE